ncbi:SEP-domain-containing protein [Aulographum hederae CBS 113979]|uniref:SEP-domain-containing protein n=1 Tax=Aulographum hederae CBS 113979 TaxID=1176131 RepID=A0A6G1H044_9PEZI|nr:SEP-domain-containing protein [Aulographum hederae CBS 113979]
MRDLEDLLPDGRSTGEPPQDERDEKLHEFCRVTGRHPVEAYGNLAVNDWNSEQALSFFYEQQEQAASSGEWPGPPYPFDFTYSDWQQGIGPNAQRATAGGSASHSGSASPAPGSRPSQRGVAGARTLRDIAGGPSAHAGHGHSHDSDEDDDDEQQDFFAGGEKSGLAVQNPGDSTRDRINSILSRARQNRPRPTADDEDDSPAPPSRFTGGGHTLGGEDAPSNYIPDPNASESAPGPSLPRVQRVLHIWRDGFSVDDGDLYRYDDPANSEALRIIQSGRAPLDLLGVAHGQEIDLEVHPHNDENYVRPKGAYKPFSGSGQRLGSPVPSASAGASSSTAQQPAAAAAGPASSSSSAPKVDVNDDAPTVTLQIRLGDGTQLRSRFNTTHTIGDVYSFVDATRPNTRPYALMTTFPSKELSDKGQALGDLPEFKRGGVVVQKWS